MILLTFYSPKEFNIFCYLFCRSHVIDIVDDFPVKTNFRKSLAQKDQRQQLVLPVHYHHRYAHQFVQNDW